MTSEKFHHKLGDVFLLLSGMRRNEPTNKFENAVPGGLLFGPRCRLGLLMSNSPLAVCVAFRVTCFLLDFDFDFDFGLAFRTFFCSKGAGEGVSAPWSEVDGPEVELRAGVYEGRV
jgi:hypothetical protein